MYTTIDEFCEYYGFCKYSECLGEESRFLHLVLNKTDWVVIKHNEQGTDIPENFATIRQQIRDEINRLEELDAQEEIQNG